MTTTANLLRVHERNTGHAGVNSLFSKAHSMDWDIDRDVDWDTEVASDDPVMDPSWSQFGRTPTFGDLPRELRVGLTRRELERTVNLLQVGESVAQDVCARLALLCEPEDYRNHAVAQAMDEARHHAAYVRFLQKMGFEDWDEVDRNITGIFDRLLESDDVTELVVTEQFFLESMAMPLFERLARRATNPLFRDVVTFIKRDEARHIGFGVLYLSEHLEKISEDDRIAFASMWLPRIFQTFGGGPGPMAAQRTAARLSELGADDAEGLAERMRVEQQEFNAADRDEVSSGRRVPHILTSARRAGLLAPGILRALELEDHPFIKVALSSADA